MIVAQAKPFPELAQMLQDARRVLVAGCGGCVAVCQAGGEQEARILAEAIRLWAGEQGRPMEARAVVVPRQCEPEWAQSLGPAMDEADVVVSLGCGVGVGFLAEVRPGMRVLPGLNTSFGGGTVSPGVFEERCRMCGDCVLGRTGGICPVARCAKNLWNGPCGGSADGRCEVDPQVSCAWHQIAQRLTARGETGFLEEIAPPKDWSTAGDGGPRRIVREDLAS
ncbi:MAG: methylenetetrahydrofolate reductase C-terminal domain-containing protein [Thermaerobacter sp.]|jgi:ferredoxin|nr:methylenetetrahydrofolate reductase C-terminal domain-containing protein [Thermaerobacter sp.]